jgi:hypothetical protein
MHQTHEKQLENMRPLQLRIPHEEWVRTRGGEGGYRNAAVGLNNAFNVHFHLLVYHYNYTRFG